MYPRLLQLSLNTPSWRGTQCSLISYTCAPVGDRDLGFSHCHMSLLLKPLRHLFHSLEGPEKHIRKPSTARVFRPVSHTINDGTMYLHAYDRQQGSMRRSIIFRLRVFSFLSHRWLICFIGSCLMKYSTASFKPVAATRQSAAISAESPP